MSEVTITRQCIGCKQTFPLTAEYFHQYRDKRLKSGPKQYFFSRCKACYLIKSNNWRNNNRDRTDAAGRKHRLRRFGLTPADDRRMHEAQGYKCAICGNPPLKRYLAVDHDHVTGRVRGLLCKTCNVMLGYAFDNPNILRAGAIYLEQHA